MADVFDVLAKDHAEVQRMLAEFGRNPALAAGSVQDALLLRKKMAEALVIEESGHEALEEMYFWPVVRERVIGGDVLADEATGQEQGGKAILDKLDKADAWDPEFETLLATFIKAAREHIRFEETRVWPQARMALSSQEAAELGAKVAEGKKTAPTRPPLRGC
jgi:hypothetical protein